jgi:hypothetical protein
MGKSIIRSFTKRCWPNGIKDNEIAFSEDQMTTIIEVNCCLLKFGVSNVVEILSFRKNLLLLFQNMTIVWVHLSEEYSSEDFE